MDKQTLKEVLECAVCLNTLDHTNKVLPCQHTFCRGCLEDIVNSKQELRCPECRFLVEIRVEDLPANLVLNRLLEGLRRSAEKPSSHLARSANPLASTSSDILQVARSSSEKRKSGVSDRNSFKSKVDRRIKTMMHASRCQDTSCQHKKCKKMKDIISHYRKKKKSKDVKHDTRQCSKCSYYGGIIHVHAKHCSETVCAAPYCARIKLKRQLQAQAQQIEQMKIKDLVHVSNVQTGT